MEILPGLLLKLLLLCACLGAAVGMLCDAFELICSFLKKKGARWRAARFFGDFVAVLVAALGVIVLCYYFNNGTVRGFCFLGVIAGFFVYRYTISRPFCVLVQWAFGILFKIFRIVLLPFAKIFTFLVKILRKTKFYLAKVLEKNMLLVYNVIKYKYIYKKSRKGFIDV
ncbi:MAG: hypothetical protein E7653_03270 [Ruminococcaceae bacterium]|nr:hypothetical protein [Oscillospiraceae bacterium]